MKQLPISELKKASNTTIHHHHHHHHHQSLNREGRWGTTDDFATSFLHFSLFSSTLWGLPNSRPVHSLKLSSHLFLCQTDQIIDRDYTANRRSFLCCGLACSSQGKQLWKCEIFFVCRVMPLHFAGSKMISAAFRSFSLWLDLEVARTLYLCD